jgi:hypothetical protein
LWSAIACVVAAFVFSWGDDTDTHVYRIVALSEQIRNFVPSLLLTNTASGIVVPTFVYYSVLPYVVPAVLNLLGVPAVAAFKIFAVLMIVVMGAGLQSLIDKVSARERTGRLAEIGCLAGVMFVTANYVYVLWTSRASLGEFCVYALIPWVVSAALSRQPVKGLILAFFLQAAAHPLVFAHSLICEVPVAMGLLRMGPLEIARRWAPPMLIALVLAIPFWLPQALWSSLILGPAALPADFRDSFQTFAEMVNANGRRNIGLWMPLAIVAMIAISRGRISCRAWLLAGAWAVLMALQTDYLSSVTAFIPTLSLSLFVWRLMLPAAFLGFAALFVGWPDGKPESTHTLRGAAGVSVLTMALFSVIISVNDVPRLAAARADRAVQAAYDRDTEASIWGVREYWPNYALLPQACPPAGDVDTARFGELRTGLRVTHPFVAIERGPVGLVDYSVDGVAQRPSACDTRLVLGPLPAGSILRVSEAKLDWLMAVRGVFIAGAALVLARMLVRRSGEARGL